MKFKLDTSLPDFHPKIIHGKQLVFLGSCFSDEMALRFERGGFHALSNPFGTIFHPIPLARILENTLNAKEEFHLFEDKELFYSWNASHVFCGNSREELNEQFRRIQSVLREKLQQASHLFVTFGTAWGYHLPDEQLLVANCHKQPAGRFEKKLTEIESMAEEWGKVITLLQNFNPSLKIIFTVSPVRHSRDGLSENNRSKARLFEVISRLEAKQDITYFPSYELVIDELRDYRFFREDLIHPNDQAISYIWEKVQEGFCTPETRNLIREVGQLHLMLDHRPINEREAGVFAESRAQKIKALIEKHPEVYFPGI